MNLFEQHMDTRQVCFVVFAAFAGVLLGFGVGGVGGGGGIK